MNSNAVFQIIESLDGGSWGMLVLGHGLFFARPGSGIGLVCPGLRKNHDKKQK
jgi:hypothetical protein